MLSSISAKKVASIIGVIALLLIITFILTVGWGNAGTKVSSTLNPQYQKQMSYHTNIIKETNDNEYFRRVLFTGKNSQLVVMNIPAGGEVGEETHQYTEQTLFFLSGSGEGELDGKKFPIAPGDAVVVVPGTKHNFRNTGTQDLKIYTVYAPANHIDGRIHKTKADADVDVADEAVGEVPQII